MQKVMDVRKLALLPVENLTNREKYLYEIYCTARSNVTGSMVELYNDLEISKSDFYRLLDSDIEFANAVKCGLNDSRGERCIQLESKLIDLALGTTTTEERVTDDGEEHIITTRVTKKNPPNLGALQLLLEHYEGSKWSITNEVNLTSGSAPQEIDYSMLTPAQLKKLSAGVEQMEEGL